MEQTATLNEVNRYRTAIERYALSTPMQALARHGYLDASRTIFDYGCGRGGDLRILANNGVSASGWDPYFAPDNPKVTSDIINLGFVINVIENPKERAEALSAAYGLARQILVVSAMLVGRGSTDRVVSHSDGVLTSRNTFQKYFTQSELKAYIEHVLSEEAIAVGPGVFFVFKDKLEEQRFLSGRQVNRAGLHLLLARTRLPKLSREERDQKLYEEYQASLDAFWLECLSRGREPHPDEAKQAWDAELQERFGATKNVFRFLLRHFGPEALDTARLSRIDDLTVYFALNLFNQRKPYGTFPDDLQRDVREFFGSYKNAQTHAMQALISVGQPKVIEAACRSAAAEGLGYLESDHSLQLHRSLVNRLPPVLRIYIGCAARLYGDVDEADLVKIHIQSGKLSLMIYDDFDGKPIPLLKERIKIKLREQDIDFFEYGDSYKPQALYLKSRFMSSDQDGFEKQAKFDRKVESLDLCDFSGFGPDMDIFERAMAEQGMCIKGFQIRRTKASD